MRMSLKVVGTAPIVDGLHTCLTSRLTQGGAYVLVDKLPVAELVVYANTDLNDDVNVKGVSVAIAYIDHVDALRLGKSLLIGPNPTTDADAKAATIDLIRSGGILDRLNVAHMGTPSDRASQDLCGSIVDEFCTKFPASTAK